MTNAGAIKKRAKARFFIYPLWVIALVQRPTSERAITSFMISLAPP
jgi:hypothetical protein